MMVERPHRPLTVMQLVPAMHSGGVERGTVEVATALVAAGHRAIVVSDGGRLVEALEKAGAEHIEIPVGRKSLSSLRYVSRLRQIWQERVIDIAHARSRLPAWLTYLAWRGLPQASRPSFVTTVHGAYSINAYSAIMLKGERVIAVSNTIAQYITSNYPDFDPARMTIIHRGVDRKAFPLNYQPSAQWLREWRERYPALAGKRLLTLAGRLTRRKGHLEFFDLIERLARESESIHGLVVGGAQAGRRRRYTQMLEREARRRDLPVTFTGHRSDIREIYAISDIVFALSTLPESFGRSALEALALGRPVVGFDHGGVGEILRAIYPGGAIAMNDLQTLTATTWALLANPPKISIEHHFPLSTMLDKTLQLYEDVAAPAQVSDRR